MPSEDNTKTVGTPLGDGLSTALSTLLASAQLEVELTGVGSLSTAQQNAALAGVTNLLQPVLTALDDEIADLFAALGLTLGGADITIFSLNADQPALAR